LPVFPRFLAVPAIEVAAEVADQTRLTIIGGWLAALAIGAVAGFALWHWTFDATPSRRDGPALRTRRV